MTENKTKVLFMFSTGRGAGSERMTVNIANFLDKDKYEIQFVLFGKKDGIISEYIPKEYKPYIVPIRTILDFPVFRLSRMLKQEKPDIVFCSLHYLNFRLILAAKLVGSIKIIIRGDNTLDELDKLSIKAVQYTYRYADRIICQTEELKDELKVVARISDEKIIVLHNYIDTSHIDEMLDGQQSPYTDNNEVRFVCTSRCKPEKAQDVLLNAFALVHEKIGTAHLYLVGIFNENEPYCQTIKKQINDNNLRDYVHIVGFTYNPFIWVKYADCFVLPSRREGLPNALVEAMYINKPVVACGCIPIIKRMIDDGYNGYVVPVDDVKQLANCMIKALDLKDFSMIYKPATKEDYVNVFDSVV